MRGARPPSPSARSGRNSPEFGAGLLLAVHDPGAQEGYLPHVVPQPPEKVGVLAHGFGNDIAGAVECGLDVRHIGGEEGGPAFGRRDRSIGKDCVGQCTQTTFASDFRLGAALRLVGQVDVFEFRLGNRGGDLAFELVGLLPWPRSNRRSTPAALQAHADR